MIVDTKAGLAAFGPDDVAVQVRQCLIDIPAAVEVPVNVEARLDDLNFKAVVHPDCVSFNGAVTFPLRADDRIRIDLNRRYVKGAEYNWIRWESDGAPIDLTGVINIHVDAVDMKNIRVIVNSTP
jgi:hypothetical protein